MKSTTPVLKKFACIKTFAHIKRGATFAIETISLDLYVIHFICVGDAIYARQREDPRHAAKEALGEHHPEDASFALTLKSIPIGKFA